MSNRPFVGADAWLRVCAMAAGWSLLMLIAVWTLGPIGLRPQTGHAQAERFGAFLVLGALFSLGYPRRWPWLVAGLVVLAIVLEFGQGYEPGRHPGWPDGLAKIAGAVVGVALTQGALAARRKA